MSQKTPSVHSAAPTHWYKSTSMIRGLVPPAENGWTKPAVIQTVHIAACAQTAFEAYALADVEAGSAGLKKRWRCDNYQHKTNGRKRHERRRKAVQDSRSF